MIQIMETDCTITYKMNSYFQLQEVVSIEAIILFTGLACIVMCPFDNIVD